MEIRVRQVRRGDIISMTRVVLASRGFRGIELEMQMERDLARFREHDLVELIESETLIAETEQRMVGIMRYGEFDEEVHLMRPEVDPSADQEKVCAAFLQAFWTCLPETVQRAVFIDYPVPQGLLGPVFEQQGFVKKVERTDMRIRLTEPVPTQEGPLDFHSYTPELHQRFLQAFQASFTGSLDPMMEWDSRHPEESFEIFRSRFGVFEPHMWVLATDRSGADVGFALFQHFAGGRYAGDMVLLYMAVLQEARGQGYGEVIVREGLRRIRALRGEKAAVSLTVSQPNEPAARIYRRVGFRPVESFAVYAMSRPTFP